MTMIKSRAILHLNVFAGMSAKILCFALTACADLDHGDFAAPDESDDTVAQAQGADASMQFRNIQPPVGGCDEDDEQSYFKTETSYVGKTDKACSVWHKDCGVEVFCQTYSKWRREKTYRYYESCVDGSIIIYKYLVSTNETNTGLVYGWTLGPIMQPPPPECTLYSLPCSC